MFIVLSQKIDPGPTARTSAIFLWSSASFGLALRTERYWPFQDIAIKTNGYEFQKKVQTDPVKRTTLIAEFRTCKHLALLF